MPLPILVISCSLSPASRSRVLAHHAAAHLEAIGAAPSLVDLAGADLPLCDGDATCDSPAARALRDQIAAAAGVLLAFPIYNFAASAAAKNLIELTGSAWEGQVVAMACAAGAISSLMAPMGLAQSLMLDYRCIIVPRFVLATPAAFADPGLPEGRLVDAEVRRRMDALASELARLSAALRGNGRAGGG